MRNYQSTILNFVSHELGVILIGGWRETNAGRAPSEVRILFSTAGPAVPRHV